MTSRRAKGLAYGLCLVTAFLVWNGIFGLLVSRGEKQYLLDQSRHELGRGPEASLPNRMRGTIADGIGEATRWAVVVFVLGALSVWLATRPPTDEESSRRPGGLLDD